MKTKVNILQHKKSDTDSFFSNETLKENQKLLQKYFQWPNKDF